MKQTDSLGFGDINSGRVRFEGVREWQDIFLALFPHRFDYIFAPHAHPGETPTWQTESRHPLSDRLIRQGAYLYGVRFGAETNYCLLDIDAGSIYHPQRDAFAIARIVAALEPLGLVDYVVCTSSYSGGLHLYFPFPTAQSSWQLAIALASLLGNAGFKVQPGQLEVFPNPKPYAIDGNLSLFNAHRLPLQSGSYLLNREWQTIWSDTQTFVRQWQFAQQRNDVDRQVVKQILKQAKRSHFGISGKAEKFINDLNAEIELGWTGSGQTNRLLGRITMRAYIFHHILSGGEPLRGESLVHEIVETAQSLPGYREWCRHQHEIFQRAIEWARCIEASHYFHFGDRQKLQSNSQPQDPNLTTAIDHAPSWNQRQSAVTRERIRFAIADLLEKSSLPARPTARFQALLQYGIGGASLYRHRDLWHPNHIHNAIPNNAIPNEHEIKNDETSNEIDETSMDETQVDQAWVDGTSVENPPYPPNFNMKSQLDCFGASNWLNHPSLLPVDGGNSLADKGSSNCGVTSSESNQGGHNQIGAAVPLEAEQAAIAALDLSTSDLSTEPAIEPLPEVQYVRQALAAIKTTQAALRTATQQVQTEQQRIKSAAAVQRQIARMQQFLNSGDPILIAEARAWAEANPGLL